MTGPAKLLIVFIFILSLAFACVSAILFTKREDFHKKYKDEAEARRIDVDNLTREKNKLQTMFDVAERTRNELSGKVDQQKLSIDDLAVKLKNLDIDRAEWKKRHDDLNRKLEGWVALQERWSNQVETLKQDLFKREAEILQKTRELSERDTTIHELRRGSEDLQNQLDNTKVALNKANQTAGRLQEILDVLYDRFIDVRPIIESGIAVPDINGKVLFVSLKSGNVIINVGEKQGVRRNFEFTVYRNSKYVGKIRIIDLQDGDMAAGKIINQDEKLPIQQGDSVATRIGIGL